MRVPRTIAFMAQLARMLPTASVSSNAKLDITVIVACDTTQYSCDCGHDYHMTSPTVGSRLSHLHLLSGGILPLLSLLETILARNASALELSKEAKSLRC